MIQQVQTTKKDDNKGESIAVFKEGSKCERRTSTNIPKNDHREIFGVLYNATYGGWSPSKQVTEMYNTRMNQMDPSFVPIGDAFDIVCLDRHDPLLIEIHQELGKEFDECKVSKTKVAMIPHKYKDYYVIREYDGLESISIDLNRYKLDKMTEKYKKIQEILSSDNTTDNDEKIRQMKDICKVK